MERQNHFWVKLGEHANVTDEIDYDDDCNFPLKKTFSENYYYTQYSFKPKENGLHVIEYSEFERAQAEIVRLKKIIAKELAENDGLGMEFVYVTILKDELRKVAEVIAYCHLSFNKILNCMTDGKYEKYGRDVGAIVAGNMAVADIAIEKIKEIQK